MTRSGRPAPQMALAAAAAAAALPRSSSHPPPTVRLFSPRCHGNRIPSRPFLTNDFLAHQRITIRFSQVDFLSFSRHIFFLEHWLIQLMMMMNLSVNQIDANCWKRLSFSLGFDFIWTYKTVNRFQLNRDADYRSFIQRFPCLYRPLVSMATLNRRLIHIFVSSIPIVIRLDRISLKMDWKWIENGLKMDWKRIGNAQFLGAHQDADWIDSNWLNNGPLDVVQLALCIAMQCPGPWRWRCSFQLIFHFPFFIFINSICGVNQSIKIIHHFNIFPSVDKNELFCFCFCNELEMNHFNIWFCKSIRINYFNFL